MHLGIYRLVERSDLVLHCERQLITLEHSFYCHKKFKEESPSVI